MTDHKLTDDEIIKALELCFTPSGTDKTCKKCPFHKIVLCKIERDRAALALLNRQKVEIEKLTAERDKWRYTVECLLEERTDHSEAIKEFAERVKAHTRHLFRGVDVAHIVDELVEMTEEKE